MAGGPWRGYSEVSTSGDTVTLKRFQGAPVPPDYYTPDWLKAHAREIALAAVLDVETSGLNPDEDKIIEIGITLFKYHRETGEYLAEQETYSGLQDPGFPLSAEIKALTGLTDEALKGERIDWLAVERLLAVAEVVIAHNAGFDRGFVEKCVPAVAGGKLWACSLKQIDWPGKGFGVQKLEILGLYHGFFTDSHRALNDAQALLHLIQMRDADTGAPYLKELLTNARRPFVKLSALYSPFESKDILKQRRYRWDPTQKTWYKQIYQDALPAELKWLESMVYKGPFRGRTDEIPLTENFRS
ncbi:MAG: 3'-5' exonuclease [Oligoflexia bacterium]|nr:3'-5' exonuclease [Oligoflexia bacterium]